MYHRRPSYGRSVTVSALATCTVRLHDFGTVETVPIAYRIAVAHFLWVARLPGGRWRRNYLGAKTFTSTSNLVTLPDDSRWLPDLEWASRACALTIWPLAFPIPNVAFLAASGLRYRGCLPVHKKKTKD